MGVRDEEHATGARPFNGVYSKPDVRSRVTGSASATGSRLNIQRATAIPRAA